MVTNILDKYGCNLSNKFKSKNADAHTTLLSNRESNMLRECQKDLVRKSGEEVIEVNIKGIVVISNEMDLCLGLEIEVPGNKRINEEV